MYSPKAIHPPRTSSAARNPAAPKETESVAAEAPRRTEDDWCEECSQQASALGGRGTETGIFVEFRRKLAMGEALSRAVAKLAEALRFSGRITVSFHQGRVTKTVLEELHIRNTKATEMSP